MEERGANATAEKAAQQENGENSEKKHAEVTLKFGKGCVGEEFQGKDGNSYREILVPNVDKEDHRPWQTFVVKANHVHENQFGKGMWCKLPAEGHTTLRRNVKIGQDEQGKPVWDIEKTKVANKDLKKMVEAYKERSSMKEKLAEKKTEAAQQKPVQRTAEKAKEASL